MAEHDNEPLRFLLQAFNYAVFMGLVWYFASAPAVRLIGEDEAKITIAFAHAGQLREPCRTLSQEELNKLAPNMRKLDDCPRERSPVVIEAALDGESIYSVSLPPPGLFGDGGVDVFYSAKIPAGDHHLSLKMNDSVRVEGFNHLLQQTVSIEPTHILLVGFEPKHGFVLTPAQD
ncbi:MAG: hypothetical protein GY815_09725 [Gammaproteobacteria bacterium]|nr:hypothetical protein [Gammaproteobacteria bacterium]